MSWVVCPSRTAFQAVVIQEIAVKLQVLTNDLRYAIISIYKALSKNN